MISWTTVVLAIMAGAAAAQDTSIVIPTTAAPSATAIPKVDSYEYAGCWNETNQFPDSAGLRALGQQGNSSINNTMTITSCLAFCASADAQFAGLEYGRECYCSPYLSVLSEKLNETARCNFACNGNTSQICGGMNAITLYNRTQGSTGVAWRLGSTEHGYGVLALVFMLIAAFL